MKFKLFILIFTITGLSFASCNKDNDAVNPTPPNGGGGNPPANTISVPSTLTFTETGAGRSNTEIKYSYEYQNGKPSKVTVTGGSNPHTITFEYSPSNPNQLIQTIRTEGATTITEAYIYNANTIEVSHNGNLYSTITLGDKQITEVIGSATNTYHYDNEGNITSVTGTDNETITYDGKSNYFASLNLSSAQAFLVADKLNPYSRVKCLTQNPATISGGYEFIYTYNSNNTPSSATIGLNGTQILSSTTIYKNITPPKPVFLPKTITREQNEYIDGVNTYRNKYTSTYTFNPNNNQLDVFSQVINYGAVDNEGKWTYNTGTFVIEYSYNNDNKLESKTYISTNTGEDFTLTVRYDYNTPGIIKSYSEYIGSGNTYYTEYALDDNNYIKESVGESYKYIYLYNPSNGNLTTDKRYTSQGILESYTTYTYDTKNNIFADINSNNSPAQVFIILMDTTDALTLSNVNNTTSETWYSGTGIEEGTKTINYNKYNEYNFPINMSYVQEYESIDEILSRHSSIYNNKHSKNNNAKANYKYIGAITVEYY